MPPMMPPPGTMPPPPNFMMPPMYMAPQPPPRRGGFARSIFTVLATTILGISLTLNVYLILASAVFGGGGGGLREGAIVDGDPAQKIAVIPLTGIIDGEVSAQLDRFLRTALADKDVKGVVIHVDSPGGTVTAADEIYHRIKAFKQAKKVPVVVYQAGLAASGGYYVSCAADYIIAQPATLTGNIGVLMPRYNISKLMEKHGVEETTITSSGADFKNAGSMFRPADPEHDKYLQDLADKAFGQFKDVIYKGRSGKMTTKEVDAASNGKIYTARDAKNMKLIDDIGYADDAYTYVATQAGLSNKTVIKYQNPPTLLDILNSKSNLPAPGASSNVTINGVNVDAKGISELMTPRLMYLWRGE